jgi:hypothetical protein
MAEFHDELQDHRAEILSLTGERISRRAALETLAPDLYTDQASMVRASLGVDHGHYCSHKLHSVPRHGLSQQAGADTPARTGVSNRTGAAAKSSTAAAPTGPDLPDAA